MGANPRLFFKMKLSIAPVVALVLLAYLATIKQALGVRFVIDKEECFSQKVEYKWESVQASFVVIKYDSSWRAEDGIDLVVKGPDGEQIRDFHDKTSEKFDFVAEKEGVYKFCFTNRSPYHEYIDFDVHAGHFGYYDHHAKDEHLKPIVDQIGKLKEALYSIRFEQRWLEAMTERQATGNESMSKRAIHKAVFESAALISASVLQVILLRRLFEKKLNTIRV